MKKGDLTANFHIRTNDQLQELSQSLVETTEFFRNTHSRLLSKVKQIKEIFGKDSANIDPEAKKTLDEIDNIVSQLKI